MRRIFVVFTNDDRTCAIVTTRTSWLARLFGRRPMTAEVEFYVRAPYNWRYAVDGGGVDEDLSKELDWHRRWQQAGKLPVAELRAKGKIDAAE
jgi:hypothetical protein